MKSSGRVTETMMEFAVMVKDRCLGSWQRWRPDYEDELRRRYYRFRQDAANNLDPRKVEDFDDPGYLLTSILNSWREAFGAVGGSQTREMVRELRDLRNEAQHRPRTITQVHIDRAEELKRDLLGAFGVAPTVLASGPPASGRSGDRAAAVSAVDLPALFTFYVVCDVSFSMAGAPIEAVNRSLRELHAIVSRDPVLSERMRICVMQFSTSASVVLPLSNLLDVAVMPSLQANGITNYGQMFDLLHTTIEADRETLETSHTILRPVVFLMTDGSPHGDYWVDSATRCLDASRQSAPKLVLAMVGDVEDDVRRHLEGSDAILPPTFIDYRQDASVADSVAKVIGAVAGTIMGTVVNRGAMLDLRFD